MTRTQKILRPIINFLVERFFPDNLFCGYDMLEKWRTSSPARAAYGETAVLSLAVQCHLAGADHMTVDITGASYKGEPIGDWRVTMTKAKP
jgi:hypothetical protein